MTAAEAREQYLQIAMDHNGHFFPPPFDTPCPCDKCQRMTEALMSAWRQGRADGARECAEIALDVCAGKSLRDGRAK